MMIYRKLLQEDKSTAYAYARMVKADITLDRMKLTDSLGRFPKQEKDLAYSRIDAALSQAALTDAEAAKSDSELKWL
jgi:hypothetical protein